MDREKKSKYNRIAWEIRNKIDKSLGSKLDLRIRIIAAEYKCSLYTAQQAIKVLKNEGLLEVKHGSKISVKKEDKSGVILNFLPDWKEFGGITFTSQLFFGVTIKASSFGWTTESSVYHNQEALFKRVKEMDLQRYKGLVCGNLFYDLVLNYFKETDIKVVTTNRYSSFAQLPRTVDNFQQGADLLVKELKNRGITKPFLFPMEADDTTYGSAVSIIIDTFSKNDISLPDNRILHLNLGIPYPREIDLLLEQSYKEILESDFIFTFTPNILQKLIKWFATKKIDLKAETTLGTLSILSIPLAEADIILESDIFEHGRQAAEMLQEWDTKNKVPENSLIPMKLITSV